jgi:saccharopine dehydrogenase-like NADP-dependent oxidoreductase
VLGAAGTIAPAIVRDLALSDEVDGLVLLDIDDAKAEQVASLHGGTKARAALADARATPDDPSSLARALQGCDVLVNAASYRVNLDAMAACLRVGCHYLDLGGLYWMTELQMELAPQFERQGLLAVLGIGSAPGKTNLMAKLAVQELQAAGDGAAPAGYVESIDVSAAGRDLDPPAGFSVPYALRTLLDELTMRPVVLHGGHPEEIEPLSGGDVVDFGDPIGPAETIHTLHSELCTFGDSFGCREASFRLSLSPNLMSVLRRLLEASDAEVEEAASGAVPPSARTVSVHVVQAAGEGRAVRVRSVTEPMLEWGMGGGIVSTAAPAAAAVRLLARGDISARGALPPERCIEPEEMFVELARRGCRIEVTTPEGVRA